MRKCGGLVSYDTSMTTFLKNVIGINHENNLLFKFIVCNGQPSEGSSTDGYSWISLIVFIFILLLLLSGSQLTFFKDGAYFC